METSRITPSALTVPTACGSTDPVQLDILALIGKDESVCCHVIVEGGTKGPGDGRDVQFSSKPCYQESTELSWC
jgi:hypothetical protein